MVVCVIMVSITLGYDIEALNLGGIDLCPVGFESWSDIAQNVYVDRHPETLHCYCDASSSRAAQMDGCKNYYQALTVARLFRAATAVCCCFSAVFIDIILAAMLPFEKHIATDSQEKSRMWRSLLFKVVFYGIKSLLFSLSYLR